MYTQAKKAVRFHQVNQSVGRMEATFEREIVEVTSQLGEATSQLEERSRNSSKHLEEASVQLEKNFDFHSETAKVSEEIANIQCTVDEANKVAEKKEFYLLLEKLEEAIHEVKNFRDNYRVVLPEKVFLDLRNNLSAYTKSLNTLRKTIKKLGMKPSLRDRKHMSKWIRDFEVFSFIVEGHLESLPYYQIEEMYINLSNLLKRWEQKASVPQVSKGEPFVPELKKNAKKILESVKRLVLVAERAKANVLATQSAEAKAIDRIHSKDKSADYITVGELGSTIDLTKLNERLNQRGYNIQIPCEDSPTG